MQYQIRAATVLIGDGCGGSRLPGGAGPRRPRFRGGLDHAAGSGPYPDRRDAAHREKTETGSPGRKVDARPKEEVRRQSAAAVPRSTFEDRSTPLLRSAVAHAWRPTTGSIRPSRNTIKSPASSTPPDNALVARDAGRFRETRCVVGQHRAIWVKGNNVTVVVPLFQILNSLSPGPRPVDGALQQQRALQHEQLVLSNRRRPAR